jgi:hypothetical protein
MGKNELVNEVTPHGFGLQFMPNVPEEDGCG